MITFDEDDAKGIYAGKFYNVFRNVGILVLFLSALMCFCGFVNVLFRFLGAIIGFPWTGKFKFEFDLVDFFSPLLFLFALMVIFCLVVYVVKYYFYKINCWMVLDKKKLYVIGYLRGQKFEKIVNVKDIKQVEWTGGYSYKGKNYTEVTLYLTENEKIKNIPVEYKSELYYFLKELNKA